MDLLVWILVTNQESRAVSIFIAPWTLQSSFFFFHIRDIVSSLKPHSEVGITPIMRVNRVRLSKVNTLLKAFYLLSFGAGMQIQIWNAFHCLNTFSLQCNYKALQPLLSYSIFTMTP